LVSNSRSSSAASFKKFIQVWNAVLVLDKIHNAAQLNFSDDLDRACAVSDQTGEPIFRLPRAFEIHPVMYRRSHDAVIRVYDEAGNERMRILPEGDATGAVPGWGETAESV
jgi:hypothetical protein